MRNYRYISLLSGILFSLAFVAASCGSAMAGAHYVGGSLGINAGSLPPPGFHYKMYNVFYKADSEQDSHGDDIKNMGLDVHVFANVHQFAYISDYKLLGANVGADILIPFVYTDLSIKAAGVDEDSFGLGDFCVEPFILAWHYPRYDVSFAAGFYAPTGDHDEPSSPGKGYWTAMETLGGTYYFDDARTWTISLLTRWEQSTKDDDTETTPGPEVVAEYGVGKMIPLDEKHSFTLGAAGYSYTQLFHDSGTGASDDRFSGHAAGPEIRFMTLNPIPFQIGFRYLFEYAVRNQSEGNTVALNFTASF